MVPPGQRAPTRGTIRARDDTPVFRRLERGARWRFPEVAAARRLTARGLLRELERLTHAARMRRLVDVGRLSATDRSARSTLAALERSGPYERALALQSCYGSRDGAHVLRALADPSGSVRALALSLVALLCDDDQALAAIDLLPSAGRRRLLKRLRLAGRTGPACRPTASRRGAAPSCSRF
jgi:hypothetical protein